MEAQAGGRARGEAPGAATLARSIEIRARPETVFAFFTDSERWAAWWGEGSSIDARPGGRVLIRYPGGVEVHGEVVAVAPPRELRFTYGYASGDPLPPGSTTVTIALEPAPRGTTLHLLHDFGDAPAARDAHLDGWRYQLAVFANLVFGRELRGPAERAVDGWYAAFSGEGGLEDVATEDVVFRDRWACVSGREELAAHIDAARRHGGTGRIARRGDLRLCQGHVLAEWEGGATLFELDPDGRILAATGF